MDLDLLQELLADAAELPPDQRAPYLDSRAPPADVRARVEELLKSYDAAGDFLDSPALEVLGVPKLDVEALVTQVLSSGWDASYRDIGGRVGPYRLEQLIAEGGMGTVYLGSRVDDEYHKLVAIKLVAQGLDGDDALHRFRNERQILASLEHPNIARLYDGGTTKDGRPYLVMEYVEGERIDDYCEGLNIAECLELFREVCGAVSYAHRNLLVHRDLKPSNILVTDEGVPKLLDFGIAKSLSPDAQTTATRPGQRPMTPAYASPEQIRGEKAITTASDVYTLGVLLYEFLTGSPPYQLDDDSDITIQSAILHQEPTKPSTMVTATEGPSTLYNQLRGDLDTILLKTLRKEPERRYESVQAFSDDVGRYLDHLPVEARGDALSYRVRKFVCRHRAGLVVVAAFVVVVVGFIAALIHQTRLATEERDKARAQTEIAERQKERAERTTEVFKDVLRGSDPEIARGTDITVREVLDGGAEKLKVTLAEEPEILADLLTTTGEVYISLGEFGQAEGVLYDALELRRGTEEEGESLYHLGELEWWRREYVAAEGRYRQALDVLPAGSVEHARALRGLGLALGQQGRNGEATKCLTEAGAELQEFFANEDPDLLRCTFGLALAARDRGDYARAEELFRRVVEIRRQQPAGPALGRALAELGVVRHLQGAFEEAKALHEEAIPLIAMAGETTYLAEVLAKLVPVLRRQGEDEEAETLIRRILETTPDDHPVVGYTLHNLALVYLRRGEHTEASDAVRKAIDFKQNVSGNPRSIATSLCLLGRVTLSLQRLDEALGYFEECAELFNSLDTGHEIAFAWIGLGRAREVLKGCGEAVSWYSKAFELRRQTLGEEHFQTALAAGLLGSCLAHTGADDEAEALLTSGLKALQQEFGEEDGRVVEAKRWLARFEERPP